jgi:GNAT superfamily N-acetyltransferase
MGLILPDGVELPTDVMQLKIATEEDVPTLVDLGMKFAKETEFSKYVTEEHVTELMKTLVTGDQDQTMVILYGTVGMIGGAKAPFLFGPYSMATELFWYVEPHRRKSNIGRELISAFEFWARKTGCMLLTMISLDDELGKYYEKYGYMLYERAYMKEL